MHAYMRARARVCVCVCARLLYVRMRTVNQTCLTFAAACYHQYAHNINVVEDEVFGMKKNVIALTAWNEDNPTNCPGPKCRKVCCVCAHAAQPGVRVVPLTTCLLLRFPGCDQFGNSRNG